MFFHLRTPFPGTRFGVRERLTGAQNQMVAPQRTLATQASSKTAIYQNFRKIPLRGEIKTDQRATYSIAARVIWTAVAAVMQKRMYCQRYYVRYVLRTASTAAAQRELRIRM